MSALDTNFWKKYFSAYDALNEAIPYQDLLNNFVKITCPLNTDIILDAGAGTCNLSVKLLPHAKQVIALDTSPEGLSICKIKSNAKITTRLHNLELRLPFRDNYFDKVVSNSVIHLLDKEKRRLVFEEFYRVLKVGGILVISNPHKNFSPSAIYFSNFSSQLNRHGLIQACLHIAKLVIPTLKILYYNSVIQKVHKVHDLTGFFDHNEQYNYMKESRFKDITDNKYVYAGQAILNVGKK